MWLVYGQNNRRMALQGRSARVYQDDGLGLWLGNVWHGEQEKRVD